MSKVQTIDGRMYRANMLLFVLAAGFGTAFIATSKDSRFFKFVMDDCAVSGRASTGQIFTYDLDITADIGWRHFKITHLDQGADSNGCFGGDFELDGIYSLENFQNNAAAGAGLGMVGVWALAVVIALLSVKTMFFSRHGMRMGGPSMVAMFNLSFLFFLGIVASTTVFWWTVEGKFGKRSDALTERLYQLVRNGAKLCSEGTNVDYPCASTRYEMETPGWSLSLGITGMFCYGIAVILLWLKADSVDDMNCSADEMDADIDPVKPVVVSSATEKAAQQLPDDKIRAKDRRSAKTGVRSGRAPSSADGEMTDASPDPMTYALQQGHDEELGSSQDEDEEVVYQNHQVHHNVINHSNPNRTVESSPMRIQQQYSRPFIRGNSGSYVSEDRRSFDERSEDRSDADFSETNSSAQYYQHNQRPSFMSASSQGDSFDEYQ